MREDSELPPLPDIMTAKEVADALDISVRMVHTYIQDGRLPAHKFGKVAAIRREDFLTFQRAKKGRPRTRLPIWRKSVGDNLQYLTIISTRLKPGKSATLAKKLNEFHAEGKHQLPGTVGRYIARSQEDKNAVQIVLVWRSTVLPDDKAREAEVQDMKEELADILDWQASWEVFSQVLLHT